MKKSIGFTLIELLVVIAIIGVLVVGLIIAVNPAAQFQKTQDTKRKSDLNQIEKALEIFYQDNGKYPDATNNKIENRDWGTAWLPYMGTLPKDPNSAKSYVYASNGQNYYLYASLDRTDDSQACNGGDVCTTIASTSTACGGVCSYGISSKDVSVSDQVVTNPSATPSPPTPTPITVDCATANACAPGGSPGYRYPSSNCMVACSSSSTDFNNASCGFGYHVCSITDYLDRGGRNNPPSYTAWLSTKAGGPAAACPTSLCGGSYCLTVLPGTDYRMATVSWLGAYSQYDMNSSSLCSDVTANNVGYFYYFANGFTSYVMCCNN